MSQDPNLPPPVQPSPTSNTLLITNLDDPRIFTKPSLAHFQTLIGEYCATPEDVYAFSPLSSMSRIIVVTHNPTSAVAIGRALEGVILFSSCIRVYYGEPTHIAELERNVEEQYLRVPKEDKQFCILSPSPPFGWTGRQGEPPNKDVHAGGLTEALQRLSCIADAKVQEDGLQTHTLEELAAKTPRMKERINGSGSSTILVFDPVESGHSPDLPSIAVEDTTCSTDVFMPNQTSEGSGGC